MKDTHSRLSSIYRSMKNRCYNQSSINYKWYGGKGITIRPTNVFGVVGLLKKHLQLPKPFLQDSI